MKVVCGVVAALAISLSGCGTSKTATTTPSGTAGESIATVASGDEDLSTLVTALTTANLVDTFSDKTGPKYTVFAPTNKAFEALGNEVNCLLGNVPALTQLLEYHVVNGAVLAKDIPSTPVETLYAGHDLSFNTESGVKVIGGASEATVTQADVLAANGVVHIIDAVLIPSDWTNPCATADDSIATIASDTDDLSTLVTALTTANLVATFSDKTGPQYTVFAPTNEAFGALGDVVSCLLTHVPELTQLLEYHVVNGAVLAADIPSTPVETLYANHTLSFNTESGVKVIGGASEATVTQADIYAANGVVHIINAVLIPSNWTNPCAGSAKQFLV